jgi:hypothetical protein
MIESIVSFLFPVIGTLSSLELSFLCAGGFFFALYLLVLGLWIAQA